MLKVLACICFLVGSGGFGWIKVKEYEKRCEELSYIKYILNTMLVEIENHRTTFGETCLLLSRKLKEPYREMFAGLYQLLENERREKPNIYWERKINELSEKLMLKKEENTILNGIIRCSDATALTMPLEIIKQSMAEWDKVISEAERIRAERSRVMLCLSFTVGILLCITII